MKDQIGYAALVVLDEGDLRIDSLVEKLGPGFGKDFQKTLAGETDQQPVAITTNRKDRARRELVLTHIGIVQLGIQLDGLTFFGRFIGNFLSGLVEAVLVEDQALHLVVGVVRERDPGVNDFVEEFGFGFRENFIVPLTG